MSNTLKRFNVVFESGAELEQEAENEEAARKAAWQHRPGETITSCTPAAGGAIGTGTGTAGTGNGKPKGKGRKGR